MRLQLWLLILAAAGTAAGMGASAFNFEKESARSVTVAVVTDASAYVAIAANAGSPHSCMVTVAATGKVTLSFSTTSGCSSNGGGTGINQGDGSNSGKFARYAFHDLLTVTNKGTKAENLWVNATTSSSAGTIDVAKKTSSGAMADSDYAATSATALSLAVGSNPAYVGVRVNSSTSTSDVTGTITIEVRK